MTGQIFKELNDKEIAVLDAIIFLRINSESDVFEYDSKKVQDYLNRTGNSKKHLITPDEQRKIVIKLAFDNVIDADAIVDRDFIDTFRSVQNPEYKIDESIPKYFWWYGKQWAYETCQLNGFISIEKAYELNGGTINIRMTKDEAEKLRTYYMESHTVYLKLHDGKCCLCVSVDGKNNWKHLRALTYDSVPYKILHCACAQKHINREVNLKTICKEEGIEEDDLRSKYMSGIFQHTGSVNALKPKLIELRKKSIIFKQRANYTYNELCDLKSKLKI